jgi:DNA-directed RNA polymerase subunit omega
MKKKQSESGSLQILYKTEELLEAASNRYRITVQVANKAKRRRQDDIDIISNLKSKPIIRAILEIAEEINPPRSEN